MGLSSLPLPQLCLLSSSSLVVSSPTAALLGGGRSDGLVMGLGVPRPGSTSSVASGPSGAAAGSKAVARRRPMDVCYSACRGMGQH